MIKVKIIIIASLLLSLPCLAQVAKYDGTSFKILESGNVETECGKSFVFRDQHKDQAPKYMAPIIIKQTFKGTRFFSTFDSAKNAAKERKKCIWVSSSEVARL